MTAYYGPGDLEEYGGAGMVKLKLSGMEGRRRGEGRSLWILKT